MNNEILIYKAKNNVIEVQLDSEHDTLWLSQKQISELLDTSTDNISLHLKNIYKDNELGEAPTTEDFSVVRRLGYNPTKKAKDNNESKRL